jgi:hypothetical protein
MPLSAPHRSDLAQSHCHDRYRRAMVGPNHGPNPQVPGLLGWVNRLLMVSYSLWLIVVAWPMAHGDTSRTHSS